MILFPQSLGISKIVIARQDRPYADALSQICRRIFARSEVTLCHSGRAVLEHLQTSSTDLLLLDLDFDDADGAELLLTISRNQMVGHLVVFVEKRYQPILSALRTARVNAIIDAHADSLVGVKAALKNISNNQIYISPTLESALLSTDDTQFTDILTEAECRILQIIGTGADNQEASLLLGLQESTVQTHRRNIMRKLGISTSAKLVNEAVKLGYVRITNAGIVSPVSLKAAS